MKITMLGHTDSGKTTYMSTMYGQLQDPVGGFSLGAATSGDHDDLMAQYAKIRAGQWPAQTDQRGSYELVLQREGSAVLPFTWRDYRGGALFERSTEEQGQELIADLQAADGIVAFFPCDVVLRGGEALRPLKRIVSLLGRALRDRERRVPVALVLSKADLVEDEPPNLYELLKPLIDQMKASENVIGAFCPVSCGATFSNVDKPVLFCLCLGLQNAYREKAQEVEEIERRYLTARRKEGLWNDFTSWLDDTLSEREYGNILVRNGLAELDKAKALAEATDALVEQIQDVPAFYKEQ